MFKKERLIKCYEMFSVIGVLKEHRVSYNVYEVPGSKEYIVRFEANNRQFKKIEKDMKHISYVNCIKQRF